MNYYKARQVRPEASRPDAGKWRYTCMNDGKVWAVGYCAQDCPGHDTEEAAYEHQTQYAIDKTLRLDGKMAGSAEPCRVCQEWTDRYATIDDTFRHALCDAHRTAEWMTEAYRTSGGAGECWSSW